MISRVRRLTGFSRRAFLASTAAGLASLSGGAPVPAQEPKVLVFSDHEPLGGMRTRFLKEVLFPAIEAESSGRRRIEDHWNGELAGPYDAMESVGTGERIDMATVVPEYAAEAMPLHQIFKGFPMGPTGSAQIEFFRRVYREIPAFAEEMAANNLVTTYLGTGYPVAFFGTAPIESLDDVAGGSWRTASFWHRALLANVGATPVTMPWGPEVPEALRAGTIDGLMVNVDSGYMLNVHDPAPHVLVSRDLWLGHVYPLAMNKDTWDGLAREDRDAIGRAADSAYAALGSVMAASFDRQIEDLRDAGATVRVLERPEVARWVAAGKFEAIQDAWAAEQRAENVEAAPVLAAVRAIMSDFAR